MNNYSLLCVIVAQYIARLLSILKHTKMETTSKEIIEKKIYEDNKEHEYASKGVAGTALGIGIGGLALALLNGGGRGLFGGFGSGTAMPENVNINTTSGGSSTAAPTAFQSWEKSCEDALALTNTIWGLKVNTQEQMYNHRETDITEKFQLWKSQIDADFGLYKTSRDLYDHMNDKLTTASFGLYKEQRDNYDAVMSRISQLEKDVAVNTAIRPYQDRLLQGEIASAYSNAINYTDRRCCKLIEGVVTLPSTPTVTGYPSYCCCSNQSSASSAS